MASSFKIVFITGGSAGIGLATAQQLNAKGTQVCLFARGEANLQVAKNAMAHTASCHIFPVDAADYDALKIAFEKAIAEVGTPDVLINCAGRAIPMNFENITTAQMRQTLQVNFETAWNACHIIVPQMKATGGTIVNTSSVGGLIGVFGYTDYSASKFALIGFSEALKQEVAKYNIRVQVLCPPDTETPGYKIENKTKPAETLAISASAKLMTADNMATAFLKKLGTKQFFIFGNFDSKLSWFMKRHAPFVIDRVINSAIQSVKN